LSSPAVIFGSLLLPSIWADPPFHWASEPVERLQTLRVLRMGGRPSHLIFRELRQGELLRTLLPRTRLNRDKKKEAGCSSSPSLLLLERLTSLGQPFVVASLVT